MKMVGFAMQECAKSPIYIEVAVNEKSIWATGRDSLGDYSLTGKEEYG